MHNALAFTTSGVPLGILSQSIWARREIPARGLSGEDRAPAVHRDRGEGKLQVAAWRCSETVRARARGRAGHHGGRSGIGLLRVSHASEGAARARSSSVRAPIAMLVPEDSEGCDSMLEALTYATLLGDDDGADSRQRQTQSAHGERRGARRAGHDQAPHRRGQAKASGSIEPISVNVDRRRRRTIRPAGSEAISWVLLTNLPVNDFPSATEKIRWYAQRWGIETLAQGAQVRLQGRGLLARGGRASEALSDALQHHRRAPDARRLLGTRATGPAGHGGVLPQWRSKCCTFA